VDFYEIPFLAISILLKEARIIAIIIINERSAMQWNATKARNLANPLI
jgi:hypothetical protein